jgi:Helix-turn-helix domain of resolvase
MTSLRQRMLEDMRIRNLSLPADQITELHRRARDGEKKAPLAREFGNSRETLYQYLRSPR